MPGPPPMPTSSRTVMGGRFKLVANLGDSGVAEVFVAEQQPLGQKVQLKVLKKDLRGDAEMMARFRREAELLASVDHPAVVRVLDFGADRDGTILVMEHVDGQPFDTLLRDGPMEPRRAVHLFSQLAHGLGAIHAKGIVHRDLKPENVVITGALMGEQAKLVDFGIARLFDPASGDSPAKRFDSAIVDGAQLIGTPAYLSPEQARGEPATPASDVYSFGVLAYLMLTGRLPFTGDADALMRHHLSSRPPALEAVLPGLARHPQLTAVVMRCLEKNPVDRFENGQALAAAIDQIDSAGLDERPVMVLARPGPSWSGRLLVLLLSVGAAFAPRIAMERPLAPSTWARWLLRAGRPGLALAALQSAPTASSAQWLAQKARVLHAQGHDEEVRQMMASSCLQILALAPELRAVEACDR